MQPLDHKSDNSKEKAQPFDLIRSPIEVWAQTIAYVRIVLFRLAHLADDTDIVGTIEDIKSGIVLRGSNLWILICSIMIASIGLDVNSPAVIIGAMLISPLMSPILGIGLSFGINDRETLIKSLRNFGIAIAVSMLTAVIYFWITPFGQPTDEMLARTEPTLLDVFVAFFGGLAGIIAGSRMEKSNAIPGVAIATALMPPLCTSAFGLATGRWDIFGGAFYLFFINVIFISISTFLIVRFLKFPQVAGSLGFNRFNRALVYTLLFLIVSPSMFFLIKQIHQHNFESQIRSFIRDHFNEEINDPTSLNWAYRPIPSDPEVYRLKILSFREGSYIDQDSLRQLEARMNRMLHGLFLGIPHQLGFKGYDSCSIELIQSDKPEGLEEELITRAKRQIFEEMDIRLRREFRKHEEKEVILSQKDARIQKLEEELHHLRGDSIPFRNLTLEAKAIYPELEELAIARTKATDFESDTVAYLVAVRWDNRLNKSRWLRQESEGRLSRWLSLKLPDAHIRIVRYD
ncbi:MAG: DUF389 domain-containing protein [Bernardetiaceae bacterium]